MYSCGTTKRESVVVLKTTAFPGFKSVQVCRFDKRYEKEHQDLGCRGCAREWDHEYLRERGLLK